MFLAVSSLGYLSSCYYDNEEELYPGTSGNCDTTNTAYSSTIKTIIDNHCMGSACHGGSSAVYNFSTYDGVKASVDANRLLGAIKQQGGFSAMPKSAPKLSDCEILKIEAWIGKGARNN